MAFAVTWTAQREKLGKVTLIGRTRATVVWAAFAFGGCVTERFVNEDEERWGQAALLRRIIGCPFRSVSLDPAWLTWHDGLLVWMAQRIYDSRGFSDMPVLADMLEEAGCTDKDILSHCRSGGEHVRGCWVVDLLLSRY